MSVASSPDADVVIVGGGPAGSAAALWCVRQGLRVVLLEREEFPRHRPGETLPPGVEPVFVQLGVNEAIAAAGFTRHPGTQVSAPTQWWPQRGLWRDDRSPRGTLCPPITLSAWWRFSLRAW